MRYVSIDLETTGLDPRTCQILEFGAIIDDLEVIRPSDELPQFHRYILWDRIMGEAFALQMNQAILKKIATHRQNENVSLSGGATRFIRIENLAQEFQLWLLDNEIQPAHVVAAGKNFASFDKGFLMEAKGFGDIVKFKHRVLDPMMFFLERGDSEPPNTSICASRAGIDVSKYEVHTSLGDAQLVIDLIRFGMRKDSRDKNLLGDVAL